MYMKGVALIAAEPKRAKIVSPETTPRYTGSSGHATSPLYAVDVRGKLERTRDGKGVDIHPPETFNRYETNVDPSNCAPTHLEATTGGTGSGEFNNRNILYDIETGQIFLRLSRRCFDLDGEQITVKINTTKNHTKTYKTTIRQNMQCGVKIGGANLYVALERGELPGLEPIYRDAQEHLTKVLNEIL